MTARKIETRAEKAIEGFDDEVAERRATAEKYGVDIKNINGKYAVHIMSQQCYALEGSTVKDWCVIDPK